MSDQYDIAQWRLHTFTTLMSTVRVVALFAAIPSAAFGVNEGIPGLAYLSAFALAWVAIISRFSDLRYRLRVLNFLAMVFVVAIGAMVLIGPLGVCYLLAIPVMAVILLGLKPALITLGIGAVCMFGLGITGYCTLPVADSTHISPSAVALFTLTFICVGTFISLSCNTLIKGLSSSLEKSRNSEASLAQRQEVLHTLNEELRLTSAALGGLNEMVLIAKVVEGPGSVQPVIFANAAFEYQSGYCADEIIGRSMRILYGPDTDPKVVIDMAESMARQERVTRELVLYSKSGTPCWVEMDLVPFASESRDNYALGRYRS
jgi:PAS domain S-box-containing protein